MRRFEPFTDAELSELLISLDHRLAEATRDGNAYVWTDQVSTLLSEVETEDVIRSIHTEVP